MKRERALEDARRLLDGQSAPTHATRSLATFVIDRKFRPEISGSAIERETYTRWLSIDEADLAWLPLHAARVIDAATEERGRRLGKRPDGSWFEPDSRRESIILPDADFLVALSAFKAERAAHIRGKVAKAQEELEAAKTRMASLEGRVLP